MFVPAASVQVSVTVPATPVGCGLDGATEPWLTAKTTLWPDIGLPLASLTVIVIGTVGPAECPDGG